MVPPQIELDNLISIWNFSDHGEDLSACDSHTSVDRKLEKKNKKNVYEILLFDAGILISGLIDEIIFCSRRCSSRTMCDLSCKNFCMLSIYILLLKIHYMHYLCLLVLFSTNFTCTISKIKFAIMLEYFVFH